MFSCLQTYTGLIIDMTVPRRLAASWLVVRPGNRPLSETSGWRERGRHDRAFTSTDNQHLHLPTHTTYLHHESHPKQRSLGPCPPKVSSLPLLLLSHSPNQSLQLESPSQRHKAICYQKARSSRGHSCDQRERANSILFSVETILVLDDIMPFHGYKDVIL